MECYWFVLDRLEKRAVQEKDIYVTFNDPGTNGIGIGLADTDESYSCENGELRTWSKEGKYVLSGGFDPIRRTARLTFVQTILPCESTLQAAPRCFKERCFQRRAFGRLQ